MWMVTWWLKPSLWPQWDKGRNKALSTEIHPTAILSPHAEIAEGVKIGPYSTIGDHVTIGDSRVTLIKKSGRRARLEIDAPREISVRLHSNSLFHPDSKSRPGTPEDPQRMSAELQTEDSTHGTHHHRPERREGRQEI